MPQSCETTPDTDQSQVTRISAHHSLLVPRDIQSTVILGDPTAMLPIQ
jgi:hypothetical protein